MSVTYKGQLTLEYLLLMAVALSLFLFSVTVLLKIRDSAEKSLELIKFKYSVAELHSTFEELCAMGNGNSRVVYLKRKISITSTHIISDYKITYQDIFNKNKINKRTKCSIKSKVSHNGKTSIKNENGRIIIN